MTIVPDAEAVPSGGAGSPDDLAERVCVACRPGSRPLDATERGELLARLPEWTVREEDGRPVLMRIFAVADFAAAVRLAAAIGAAADAADHHPRLVLEWGRVDVAWWTHVIDGLHLNDFIMAARTDAIAATQDH